MKGLIGSVISWVVLFGARIGLEWLADRYDFFRQWAVIATVALIAVSIVLAITFIVYIVEQLSRLKGVVPQKSEAQQGQDQAVARKKSRERESMRSEKKGRRAARAYRRQAERDKIQRVETYEKRWRRERGGR